jgi:aspartate/methionine/tyrosine aminotransferase
MIAASGRAEHAPDLRESIAWFNEVPVEETAPALGGSHGLWLALQALAEPALEILVEHPTYEPLLNAAAAAGAAVHRFDRGWTTNFTLDPERVLAELAPNIRIVVITNLHNPSGVRAADCIMRTVATALADRGGFLLVDEVYAPFDEIAGPRGTFGSSARHLAPNIIVTGSLSKTLGLGAARIGWVLGPAPVIRRVHDLVAASISEFPATWLHEGAEIFTAIPALVKRARALIGNKRLRVSEWLAERPALAWSMPREGLYGLARVRDAASVRDLVERGIREHEVIVAPGDFFEVPGSFRLAWSLPEDALEEALERLDRLLRSAGLL